MNESVLRKIIKENTTPIYIYDAEMIKTKQRELKRSMLNRIEIFYSIKANPSLGICSIIKNLGCGCEVASMGELFIALKAGYLPYNIIFTSPGKSEEELEYAVLNNLYCINIESIDEAVLINAIAERYSKKINIAIRINPDFRLSGANIKMTGVSSQFGVDKLLLGELLKTLRTLENIKIIGLHVYLGTQILRSTSIINNFENILELAIEVSQTYKIELKFLDFGGGYGIPYFKNENPLNMVEIEKGIKKILEKYKDFLRGVRLVTESGRFLVAESGIYVTKILYRKECRGDTFLVCDGGSNHHAASAFMGRYIRNNFPMHVLNSNNEIEKVNVVGPLCTPTDIIGQKVELPKSGPGDYIIIENSGAYGLTNSPICFLSHLTPEEIMYVNGVAYKIRDKGTTEDFIKGQNCPF